MYFCYGVGAWLYLNWIPTYLAEARHFTQREIGLAATVPLLAATVTNILWGDPVGPARASMGNVRRARVAVSVGFAVAGTGLILAASTTSSVPALGFPTLALAGLELTVAGSGQRPRSRRRPQRLGLRSNEYAGKPRGTLSGTCFAYIATHYGWPWAFGIAGTFCITAALLATQVDPSRTMHRTPNISQRHIAQLVDHDIWGAG